MVEKDLKKLRRAELLEIMLDQSYEIDQLRKRIKELEEQLEDRRIKIENAGSIAEASLQLTKVFEEAQRAADLYVENVRNLQKSGAPKKKKPRRKTADSAENAVTVENSVPMNNTVSAGYTLPTEYPYSVGYTTPTVYPAVIENSASANQDAQEQPNPAGYTSGDFEENK